VATPRLSAEVHPYRDFRADDLVGHSPVDDVCSSLGQHLVHLVCDLVNPETQIFPELHVTCARAHAHALSSHGEHFYASTTVGSRLIGLTY
jgi:hypothetical protein